MEITLFQTSDPFSYYKMLHITSETARAFCRNRQVKYEAFIGLRRGNQNWHSTYNRVVYLADRVREGYDGWILHLDADAYVNDVNFDIWTYLADKGGYAMIGAPSGATEHFWDMNIGIMFFNLGHPFMIEMARDWFAYLDRFDLARDATGWSESISDDQAMFHELLMRHPDRAGEVLLESWDFMNAPRSSFVRQMMRFPGVSFEERLANIEARVAESLSGVTGVSLVPPEA
ncbi:hypothetical protein [Caulobacter sp. S45]|uniref:hypothetical protein n=1 Tax=Caulobacter sp. S45 TaxID=1641861 RepID=UPI0015755F07|nr:hypothetical protein [Caulobacter sp. S45]